MAQRAAPCLFSMTGSSNRALSFPRPFGVGVVGIYMDRDVEVDDVRVSFGDRPPESIGERADFGVQNSTGLVTARADAWILPFLNVYLMAGHTESEARLNTVITIPTPGPGDPIEQIIQVDSDVSGALFRRRNDGGGGLR